MNEKQLERKCCRIAESHGWLALKMISPNRVGVPDRVMVGPGGHIIWIEFKKEGGRLSPVQDRTITKFAKLGHGVFVVNSVKLFETVMGLAK